MKNFIEIIKIYQKIKQLAKEKNFSIKEILDNIDFFIDNKLSNIIINEKIKNKKFEDYSKTEQKIIIDSFIDLLSLWQASSLRVNWQDYSMEYGPECYANIESRITLDKNYNFYLDKEIHKLSFCLKNNREILSDYIKSFIEHYQLSGEKIIDEYKTNKSENFSFVYHNYKKNKIVNFSFSHRDIYISKPNLFMLAGLKGCSAAITCFLEQIIDINYQDDLGNNALHYFKAVGKNYIDTIEEEKIITSKLDGTYRNGYYQQLYEKKMIENQVNDPQTINNFKL